MSFKLTGDKYDEINIIKRRRVEELLASNIPKEEALLTRSGRYVCLVCRHLPFFDTVAMLTVHRKSKGHMTNANRKYIEDQEKRDEVDKRIQKGSISDDSFPQPLLKQARAATERVLMPNAPYSAIATRKRKNLPREEKDMAGSSKKLDSSSHNYFFTVSAASKLPPDTDKSHAQNQEFVGTEIRVQSVEAKVPEWKESELVQPWNAGLSKRRCCPGTKGGNHISKDTSTHASRNAAAENLKSLYVRRSGWKQAWSGEWVKDPIAEFDSESDEETEAPSETNGGS